MVYKVITFGEVMLRLAPPNFQRFTQAELFNATYAGGEANVAASLAKFGIDAYFVTKLPSNDIGQAALNYLRRFNVKTDYIILGDGRLGIYFLETGAAHRASRVIYDRANSTIAQAEADEFEWEKYFREADWFHVTGITPALGTQPATATLEAVKAAKDMGLSISIDLNYRKNLWTTTEAQKVMGELVEYADLIVGNEEDADKVLGIRAANSNINSGELNIDSYKEVASEVHGKYAPNYVAITLRESKSASHNGWSALLYNGSEHFLSKKYDILPIIDRVGGGDSFAAGLIYGLLTKMKEQEALEFAVAASCLKHSMHGDFNLVSVDEVNNLVEGDGSGRVQR